MPSNSTVAGQKLERNRYSPWHSAILVGALVGVDVGSARASNTNEAMRMTAARSNTREVSPVSAGPRKQRASKVRYKFGYNVAAAAVSVMADPAGESPSARRLQLVIG